MLEHKEYILAAVKKAVNHTLFPFAFDLQDTPAQTSSYYSKVMPIIQFYYAKMFSWPIIPNIMLAYYAQP